MRINIAVVQTHTNDLDLFRKVLGASEDVEASYFTLPLAALDHMQSNEVDVLVTGQRFYGGSMTGMEKTANLLLAGVDSEIAHDLARENERTYGSVNDGNVLASKARGLNRVSERITPGLVTLRYSNSPASTDSFCGDLKKSEGVMAIEVLTDPYFIDAVEERKTCLLPNSPQVKWYLGSFPSGWDQKC